jgi:DNA helicase-2/ATP-dependent DNA helicase PcrA
VAAPRDRERVVLKASRFVEELPGEPAVYERWQLDDVGGPPALGPAPEGPLPLPAMTLPRLFASGSGGDGGDDDVPF